MIKDIFELVKSLVVNINYLVKGGRGVRWPRTWHRRIYIDDHIEVVENQIKEVVRHHPLLEYLKRKEKNYVLRVEMGRGVLWINVFTPFVTGVPDGDCRELYNEWKGKDGTFLYTLSKDGVLMKGKRRKGVYWLDQAPLMTVRVPLERNAKAFIEDISVKEGEV